MGSSQSAQQPQPQQKSWWATLTGQPTPSAQTETTQVAAQAQPAAVGGSRKHRKSSKKSKGGKNKTSSKKK